jgi:hypothetical protein
LITGYSLGERVGAGSYASVYRAVSLAPTANGIRETVAIKCIEKNRLRTSTGADNLVQEISILKVSCTLFFLTQMHVPETTSQTHSANA